MSYAHWWRDAGLHCATTEISHGWLAEPANEDIIAPTEQQAPRQRVAETAAPVAILPPTNGTMPRDLPGFLAWLAQDQSQPEAQWGGPLFLPANAPEARLVVITDMPEAGAESAELPLAGPSARLMAAMLGSIGLPLAEASFVPLAMRRVPGGLLDDGTVAALAARMRHYFGLARPQAALILGDRTSRALIGATGVSAGANLPLVNHDGGTLPIAALPALELLMRRPLAKAASWQTLRLLTGAMTR